MDQTAERCLPRSSLLLLTQVLLPAANLAAGRTSGKSCLISLRPNRPHRLSTASNEGSDEESLKDRDEKRAPCCTALSCLPAAATAQAASPDDRLARSRAVEAVIWGMPAVNYDLMLQEMLTKTPGKVNQVIYWGQPLDWKNQTLTPNPDTLYFMTFLNTKDVGPIVIEIPPADADGSLNANIVNVWQAAAGRCRIARRGQGRRRQAADAAARLQGTGPDGYEALQPNTYGSYALIRSNLKSHATRMLRSRSRTPSRSRSIRSRRHRTRRRRSSPTSRTSCSIPPSATTRASSPISTGSCRASRGSVAIAR